MGNVSNQRDSVPSAFAHLVYVVILAWFFYTVREVVLTPPSRVLHQLVVKPVLERARLLDVRVTFDMAELLHHADGIPANA